MNKNKGIAPVVILLGLGLVVGAAVVGYLMLNSSGGLKYTPTMYTPTPTYYPQGSNTPAPVGNGDDTKSLQMELDQTTTGSVDSDLNSIDSSASSL